ncbi:hypothetical protein BGZ96_005097 [Linnemannia gamsii]|uniref:HCP-like protein n=1 Tax=Linnemannia gamsii TaxID=64522 RepID=A0ABQ7K5E7_9FUNG|nr:hypothetical protein BGZ96_005097 [Linnemannia gamsii]
MEQGDSQEEELLQTVRPVHKNNLSPTFPAPVAHIVINTDPINGKKIILWEDILQALDPLRFNAVPNDTVDIVVDGQFTSTDPPPVQSTFDQIKIRGSQYSEYDPIQSILPPIIPHDSRRPSSSSYSYETPNYRTIPTSAFWNHLQAPTQHDRIPLRHNQPLPSRPPTSRPPVARPASTSPRPAPTLMPRARMDVKEAFKRIILHIDLVALQEKGEGTPEEFTKALQCYLKKVCRGHGEAQLSVGELFAQGENVAQDELRAYEWYLKAAYQGNAVAQRKISRAIVNQPNRSAAAPEAVLYSAVEESLAESDAIPSADTFEASQNTSAKIQELSVETLEILETLAEIQDKSLESQEEFLEDTPMTTQETPNDTLFETTSQPRTNWEQLPQTSDDAFTNLLPTDPHQANDEFPVALVPYTPTPAANNPRAPQTYGHDDWAFSARVQNIVNKEPRAPQLNTSSFEHTLINAEYGDTEAQIRLGLMYMQMEGHEHDEQAVRWFFKAALREDAEGQRHVGEMFMNGHGVPQDYMAAMYWFNEAADQWNVDALFQIGNMYSEGQGVTKSYPQAAVWYTKAAAIEGSAEAQNMMGLLHEVGSGIPRNQSMALEWYLKAARQWHLGAKESVARLRKGDQPPIKGKKGFFRSAVKKMFS